MAKNDSSAYRYTMAGFVVNEVIILPGPETHNWLWYGAPWRFMAYMGQ